MSFSKTMIILVPGVCVFFFLTFGNLFCVYIYVKIAMIVGLLKYTFKHFLDLESQQIRPLFSLNPTYCKVSINKNIDLKCMVVFVMLSCLSVAALWSPARKGLASVVFANVLLLSLMMSTVRCGT